MSSDARQETKRREPIIDITAERPTSPPQPGKATRFVEQKVYKSLGVDQQARGREDIPGNIPISKKIRRGQRNRPRGGTPPQFIPMFTILVSSIAAGGGFVLGAVYLAFLAKKPSSNAHRHRHPDTSSSPHDDHSHYDAETQ